MGEILLSKSYSRLNNSNEGHRIKFVLILLVCIFFAVLITKDEQKLEEHSEFDQPVDEQQTEIETLDKSISEDIVEKLNDHAYNMAEVPENFTCQDEEIQIETKINPLAELIFLKCTSDPSSREIETYFDFFFNKKSKEFRYEEEFSDDLVIIEDKSCIVSGKSQLALRTQGFPKCIEFLGISIKNFRNRKDSSIVFKYHIFKVKETKVHIFPIDRHTIKVEDLGEPNENVHAYLDNIRLCNIGNKIQDFVYEDKFWLEINWDPKVQGMICFNKLIYVN